MNLCLVDCLIPPLLVRERMFYFDKLRLVELYLQVKVRSVFLQHTCISSIWLTSHITVLPFNVVLFGWCVQVERVGDDVSGAKDIFKVGFDFDIRLIE